MLNSCNISRTRKTKKKKNTACVQFCSCYTKKLYLYLYIRVCVYVLRNAHRTFISLQRQRENSEKKCGKEGRREKRAREGEGRKIAVKAISKRHIVLRTIRPGNSTTSVFFTRFGENCLTDANRRIVRRKNRNSPMLSHKARSVRDHHSQNGGSSARTDATNTRARVSIFLDFSLRVINVITVRISSVFAHAQYFHQNAPLL